MYTAYPYMPRLRDRSVLNAGLAAQPLLWQQEGFAFAQAYDAETTRYRGLVLPGDDVSVQPTDTLLIVKPSVAATQRAEELAAAVTPEPSDGGLKPGPTTHDNGTTVLPGPNVSQKPPAKTRFFGSKELNSERYALDFKKVADEVLAHLAATPGVKLTVRIEIEAITSTGFDEGKARTVAENAKTLKFEQSGFEES